MDKRKKQAIICVGIVFLILSFIPSLRDAALWRHAPTELEVTQYNATGYLIENGVYTNQVGDAQIDVPNLNCYVDTITVDFAEAVPNTMGIVVYYASEAHSYDEDHLEYKAVAVGANSSTIPINKEVTSCRIDIGDTTGERFSLESIVVNKETARRNPYAVLTVCVSALGILMILSALFEVGPKELLTKVSSHKTALRAIALVVLFATAFVVLISVIGNIGSNIGGDAAAAAGVDAVKVGLYCIVVLAFLLGCILCAYRLLYKHSLRIEWAAAFLVLVLGLFFMVSITPFSPPDEPYHYHSAYEVANYLSLRGNPEVGDSADFDYAGFSGHHNTSDGYLRAMEDIDAEPVNGYPISIPMSRDASYFIQFIPQALGLTLARILNLNFIGSFYLGRLFNLLFYAVCVYYAVKQASKFKLLFSLIALMPMALHQAASFSYDSFINGTALLLIALLLKAIYGNGLLPKRDFFAIMVVGMILSPTKLVYWAILLLAVLIPEERFGTRTKKYIGVGVLLFAGILLSAIFKLSFVLSRTVAVGADDLNWEGQHNYTLGFLISNPTVTLEIIFNSLKQLGIGWAYCAIGFSFSGLSLVVAQWIPKSYLLLCLASVLIWQKDEAPLSRRDGVWRRSAYILTFGIVSLAVVLIMLIGWTSDTYNVVQGVQGRYFIPVAILPFMAIGYPLLRTKQSIEKHALLLSALINAAALVQIVNYTIMH